MSVFNGMRRVGTKYAMTFHDSGLHPFSHSVMHFRFSSSILYDYEDVRHAQHKRLNKDQVTPAEQCVIL